MKLKRSPNSKLHTFGRVQRVVSVIGQKSDVIYVMRSCPQSYLIGHIYVYLPKFKVSYQKYCDFSQEEKTETFKQKHQKCIEMYIKS